jgi:hypothetical protein
MAQYDTDNEIAKIRHDADKQISGYYAEKGEKQDNPIGAGAYRDWNPTYMKHVGEEGIKRQQEKMRQKADDVEEDYQKKRVASPTKTASMAKKPATKKSARKRVAGK